LSNNLRIIRAQTDRITTIVRQLLEFAQTDAARILGVDRTALYRKLDEYKVTD
jgi:DNA-binding protein Fis